MKNIGIYVHIPFCVKKCSYCDFVSFENKQSEQDKYVERLKKEIQLRLSKLDKTRYLVDTIYFGGGTPSVIKKEYIGEVLKTINDNSNIDENIEITLEVNPRYSRQRKTRILQRYRSK